MRSVGIFYIGGIGWFFCLPWGLLVFRFSNIVPAASVAEFRILNTYLDLDVSAAASVGVAISNAAKMICGYFSCVALCTLYERRVCSQSGGRL